MMLPSIQMKVHSSEQKTVQLTSGLHNYIVSTGATTATSTSQALVVQAVQPLIVVQHKAQKEVDNPLIEEIQLVPCYRWTRWQRIQNYEFFGDWSSLENFLARLTDCGHDEGCFMVNFMGGIIYSDLQEQPTSSELVKGELVKATDSRWVTWRGIGLKRNDFGTWGICLPKTQSMDYAVSIWEELRKRAPGS